MLRTDAVRSVAVLDDLGHVLDQLRGARESTRNEGPNEKETNLRTLFQLHMLRFQSPFVGSL